MIDGAIADHRSGVGSYVTPTFVLGKKPWRLARTWSRAYEVGMPTDTDRSIAWINGHETQFRSVHEPGDVVGESWCNAVCDESGRFHVDAWDYIDPMLVVHDATTWRLGTPRGKGTRFYEDFIRGLDRNGVAPMISHEPPKDPRYVSLQAPSTLSPWWSDERVEQARRVMHPLMFQQEIMAQFLEGAAGPFGDWQRFCTGKPEQHTPDGVYVLGADLGKRADFTRLRMFRCDGDRIRLVQHWSPQGAWPVQLGAIRLVANNWGARICVDATGIGDVVVDELISQGLDVLPYVFTAASKATLIEHYAQMLQSGRLELLAQVHDPVAWQEHDDFLADPIISRSSVKTDVSFRYGHREGKHDDTVIANALGVWAALRSDVAPIDLPVFLA